VGNFIRDGKTCAPAIRLSVLALYAAHVEAAGFFGVHIGHGAKIMVILRKG